jgi:hypothetical protein
LILGRTFRNKTFLLDAINKEEGVFLTQFIIEILKELIEITNMLEITLVDSFQRTFSVLIEENGIET